MKKILITIFMMAMIAMMASAAPSDYNTSLIHAWNLPDLADQIGTWDFTTNTTDAVSAAYYPVGGLVPYMLGTFKYLQTGTTEDIPEYRTMCALINRTEVGGWDMIRYSPSGDHDILWFNSMASPTGYIQARALPNDCPSTYNISNNDWHLVCQVANSTYNSLWIDGVKDCEQSGSADTGAGSDYLYIGDYGGNYQAQVVNWLYIWNRQLNDSEILGLNNSGNYTHWPDWGAGEAPPLPPVPIPPTVYWDNSSYPPANNTKWSTSQIFYFNVNNLANCSIYANNSQYADVGEVTGDNSIAYNLTGSISEAMPFWINCSNENGSSISTVKIVTFDNINPLICPNNCNPLETNSTTVDRTASNITAFLECFNSNLESFNYTYYNSSETFRTNTTNSLGGTSYNYTFPIDTSGLAIGTYTFSAICSDSAGETTSSTWHYTLTCTEDWTCTDWNETCDNINEYERSRTCTDTNNCGTILTKPSESDTCQGITAGGAAFENKFVPSTNTGLYSLFVELSRGLYFIVSNMTSPLARVILMLAAIGFIIGLVQIPIVLIKSGINRREK